MSITAWPGTLALRLVSITKRFPGVTALDAVDLDLHWGETHALLGENGAGKSTLIKILSGVHTADEGTFLIGGAPVAVTRPSEAQRLGITIVPQDILMVPELSIGRNILLGTEGFAATRGRLSRLDRETVEAALLKVGASFDPEARTGSLSVPHLRLAQIAKSLVSTGSILVLDEPTAVLSEPDAEHLISKVQELRGRDRGPFRYRRDCRRRRRVDRRPANRSGPVRLHLRLSRNLHDGWFWRASGRRVLDSSDHRWGSAPRFWSGAVARGQPVVGVCAATGCARKNQQRLYERLFPRRRHRNRARHARLRIRGLAADLRPWRGLCGGGPAD
jgi:ABC-type branched-subunit amino acid transport system ATPase component